MVEKWKLSLKKFLKDYEENEEVTGAILYGSYAVNAEVKNKRINWRNII